MYSIIINVVKIIYEQFFASLLFAVMFIICYQRMKNEGVKSVLKQVWKCLKEEVQIRKILLFAFVLAMILFSTIFCRVYQSNPLEIVWDHWVIFKEYHILHTEPIENTLLFIPFTFCLFITFPKECFKGKKKVFWRIMWKSLYITFVFSLGIEVFQLLFHVGTFQISDLAYNTLGGVIGGIIYYILYSIKRIYRKLKKEQ